MNNFDSENPVQDEPNNAQHPTNPLRKITSSSLLQGEKEILILHGEEVYRLKLTRNGKLILQK
jgi:hemin uptake protein HemP